MVDHSAFGYTGPDFPFPIEAGTVRELGRAVGSHQTCYLTEPLVVPPLLLKVAQFRWEPSDGSAVTRVGYSADPPPLHRQQEFVLPNGPPPVGSRLLARTSVTAIRRRRSRTFGSVEEVELDTAFRDERGGLVASARSVSVQPDRAALPSGSPGKDIPDVIPPAATVIARRDFGPIGVTDIVRYQGATGDLNPVHHDPAAARRAGWPRVLVPGLLSAGVLSDVATTEFGAAHIRRTSFTFLAPTLAGDVLECRLISAPDSPDGMRRVLLCARRRHDQVVVTSGWADFASR